MCNARVALCSSSSLRSLFVTRYPYSKMCNVCNVCNALTNKSKRYCTAFCDIAAVCCDSRIVRWQEILSPSYYPLERAKRNWNHLERRRLLERAKRIWNGLWQMERSLALLERRIAATRVRVCGDNAMRVR